MLDIKRILENPEKIKTQLRKRGDFDKEIDEIIILKKKEDELNELITLKNQIKNINNQIYKEVLKMVKAGVVKIIKKDDGKLEVVLVGEL